LRFNEKELSKVQDDHVKTYQAFKQLRAMVETLTTKTNAKEAEIEGYKATIERLTKALNNAEPLQFEFEDHKECKCEATKAMNDNFIKI
jgi:predicted RNase H-like nuclease (RuvC/YqgF family)